MGIAPAVRFFPEDNRPEDTAIATIEFLVVSVSRPILSVTKLSTTQPQGVNLGFQWSL